MTCNAIHDLPKGSKHKLKVLMQKTIVYQPTTTIESDPRAKIDTVNLFMRPNKTMVYQTGENAPSITDDVQISTTNASIPVS